MKQTRIRLYEMIAAGIILVAFLLLLFSCNNINASSEIKILHISSDSLKIEQEKLRKKIDEISSAAQNKIKEQRKKILELENFIANYDTIEIIRRFTSGPLNELLIYPLHKRLAEVFDSINYPR